MRSVLAKTAASSGTYPLIMLSDLLERKNAVASPATFRLRRVLGVRLHPPVLALAWRDWVEEAHDRLVRVWIFCYLGMYAITRITRSVLADSESTTKMKAYFIMPYEEFERRYEGRGTALQMVQMIVDTFPSFRDETELEGRKGI